MLELIGRALSLLRRRYRLSQAEMARRLRWPQSVVSKVENGEVNLTVQQLDDWAAAVDAESSRLHAEVHRSIAAADVMETTDAIASTLDDDGYVVVWGTGRTFPFGHRLVRGAELEDLVLRAWPRELRWML